MAKDISLAILHSKIGYQIHTFIFPLFITHSNNNPDHNCSIQSLIFHVQLLCRKKRTSMKENILQKKLWFKELARLWVGGKSMLWLNNGLKVYLKNKNKKKKAVHTPWVCGCFIYILVQSHFELLSSVLALEATEPLAVPVAEPVAERAVELINNHLISVHQKRWV